MGYAEPLSLPRTTCAGDGLRRFTSTTEFGEFLILELRLTAVANHSRTISCMNAALSSCSMQRLHAGSQPSFHHILVARARPVVYGQSDARLSSASHLPHPARPGNAPYVRASASGNGPENTSGEVAAGSSQYRYNSGDGRPKASMEDADWTRASGPWQMSWQMNERNLVWTNDLKTRLLKVGCLC